MHLKIKLRPNRKGICRITALINRRSAGRQNCRRQWAAIHIDADIVHHDADVIGRVPVQAKDRTRLLPAPPKCGCWGCRR